MLITAVCNTFYVPLTYITIQGSLQENLNQFHYVWDIFYCLCKYVFTLLNVWLFTRIADQKFGEEYGKIK